MPLDIEILQVDSRKLAANGEKNNFNNIENHNLRNQFSGKSQQNNSTSGPSNHHRNLTSDVIINGYGFEASGALNAGHTYQPNSQNDVYQNQ